MIQEWDDVAKAQWVLENGIPDYVWIFERVDTQVYRRPSPANNRPLPPWINKEREPVSLAMHDIVHTGVKHG